MLGSYGNNCMLLLLYYYLVAASLEIAWTTIMSVNGAVIDGSKSSQICYSDFDLNHLIPLQLVGQQLRLQNAMRDAHATCPCHGAGAESILDRWPLIAYGHVCAVQVHMYAYTYMLRIHAHIHVCDMSYQNTSCTICGMCTHVWCTHLCHMYV